MNLLYARYKVTLLLITRFTLFSMFRFGRSVMEQKLKELFGEDMHEFGLEGGEIPFSKYLRAVEKVQLSMFLETNRGKKAKDLQKERNSRHK